MNVRFGTNKCHYELQTHYSSGMGNDAKKQASN